MKLARSLAGTAAAFAVMFASSVRAGDSTVMIRLDYAAAKSCPDATTFTSQLRSRAPNVRVVSDASAPEVDIRITARNKHFSGRISVDDESARSVEGDDCAEVVTALAVIGAFTLDPVSVAASPDAQTAAKDSATDSPPGEQTNKSSAAGASDAEKKNATTSQPSKPPTHSPPAHERSLDDAGHDEHSTPKSGVEFSFGAHGEVITGIAPGFVGSVPVFAEISVGAPKRIFSPSARVRFERPGSDADVTAQGGAHFTWTEASVDLCPIALWLGDRVSLRPCLRTEVGVVEGTGLNTTNVHDETRPWATLGAVAISRLSVVGPLFVEIEAALIAPIVRDRFYLDPQGATVFRASLLGASAACGAGISIW